VAVSSTDQLASLGMHKLANMIETLCLSMFSICLLNEIPNYFLPLGVTLRSYAPYVL